MIFCPEARFVYLHIPKCAGTTLRKWLRSEGVSYDRRFTDVIDIPGFIPYNGTHLPLDILQAYFPQEFAAVCTFDSATVVRHPLARFASAFAQYQREFFQRNVDLLPQDTIRRDLDSLLTILQAGGERRDTRLVHFLRQVDFVELAGQRIVKDVYPVEQLELLVDQIADRFGLTSRPRPANVRRRARFPALAWPLHQAKLAARRILPEKTFRSLHSAALSSLTDKHSSTDDFMNDDIRAFVENHYQQDFILHAEALKRFERGLAG